MKSVALYDRGKVHAMTTATAPATATATAPTAMRPEKFADPCNKFNKARTGVEARPAAAYSRMSK